MADEKKTYQISPKYPYYGLRQCVKYIETLYKKDGLAEVAKNLAIEHMGLNPKNEWSSRATGSITGFNLLEEKGPLDNRVFRLTALGKIIVLTKEMTDQKKMALREAALGYEIIKKLCEKWPNGLPAEDAIKVEVVLLGFTERSASRFVLAFRETYDFAGLGNSIAIPPKLPAGDSGSGSIPYNPPLGFEEYTLTLAKGKEVRLSISDSLNKDDVDFMLQWIKRLDLVKSVSIDQAEVQEQKNNEEAPDIPF